MARHLLFLVVFFEGFASLGAEVIALRRLLPHVGSSIIVTAPTIGFFLLALALGYYRGGRLGEQARAVLARNFLVSALLLGVGMSQPMVQSLFDGAPLLLAYLLLVLGIMAPVAYLLGQTVPALTSYLADDAVAARSGNSLYWSTLGSFLGSVALSVGVMNYLGVSAAVLVSVATLLAGYWMLAARPLAAPLAVLPVLALAVFLAGRSPVVETAYADYQVVPIPTEAGAAGTTFLINGSPASLRFAGNPPRPARYISRLQEILTDELHYDERSVLVLGAGGFSLSEQDARNRYTYVDIDPAIRAIAERDFLHAPARGRFVAADARRYVQTVDERFDALVVDVFSSQVSIPRHLLTREFWRETRRPLKQDGVLLANLILDSRLGSDYARNLLTTIESEWGRCAVEVLFKDQPQSNVLVTCYRANRPDQAAVYSDERNWADLDAVRAAQQ
jgi:predicted membrane-bound spermidine synthase